MGRILNHILKEAKELYTKKEFDKSNIDKKVKKLINENYELLCKEKKEDFKELLFKEIKNTSDPDYIVKYPLNPNL